MTGRTILHNVWKVGPSSFGLGPAVLNLLKAQQQLGLSPRVCSFDNMEARESALTAHHLGGDLVNIFPAPANGRLGFCPKMLQWGLKEKEQILLVHQHSLWTANSRLTLQMSQIGKLPTVIAPHGALEPWALKKSPWKKRLALTWYEKRNLARASCLHALSDQEGDDIRAFGLPNPIAVIPNGVASTWLDETGLEERFRENHALPADKRVLLFLSRITPKKGLPLLLHALKLVEKDCSDWVLVVAGADEFNHQREVEGLVVHLGLRDKVKFVGPLYGQAKVDAFAAAELFVLPSYSEGAPIVILEALGSGVPVLATKASPWQDLTLYECGWWVDISSDRLADALGNALRSAPGSLKAMGARGKTLVAENYTWERSAQMTLALYRWLLKKDNCPDFVRVS